MNYRSKTISLDDDTWAAFEKVRAIHGSYNKALRHVFEAGGVFKTEKKDSVKPEKVRKK